MIDVTKPALCLYGALLLAACSSAPLVRQAPDWRYEKDAIRLSVVSDPQLNLYQKKAHSLIVCLYHLRDLNGFNQLKEEKDGLARLLDCSRFDPSVTHAKRLVIQPGQNSTESLDRTEGARFVGLVAGYYHPQKNGSTRSYAVPVSEVKKDAVLVQEADQLRIELRLGRQGILEPDRGSEAAASVSGREGQ